MADVYAPPDQHDQLEQRPSTGTGAHIRNVLKVVFGIVLAGALNGWCADIHVAFTGNDSTGDGSSGAPYRTIQKGIDSMVGGDTVQVHAGTYEDAVSDSYSSTPISVAAKIQNRIGTSAAPLTIKAADGEVVTIDGAANGLHMAFIVENSDFVTISGFTIRNIQLVQTSNFATAAIFVADGEGVVASNLDIADTATDPQESYDIAMNNTVNGKIVDNSIVTTKYYSVFLGFSSPQDSPESEISGNRIEYTGTVRALGIRPARIDHVKIQNNFFLYSSATFNADSYAMQLRDMTGYIVSGNVIDGWPNGIHNFDFAGRNEEGRIINNTFVNITAQQALLAQACSGCVTANNIFSNVAGFAINCTGNNADFGTDHRILNNLYDQVVGTPELFINPYSSGAGCEDEGNHVRAAPEFEAAGDLPCPYYNISASSPARDRGDATACAYTPPDGACDIGAFEQGVESCSTPSTSPPADEEDEVTDPVSTDSSGCRAAGFSWVICGLLVWFMGRAVMRKT